MDVIEIIASILGLAIGIIVGYFVRKNISETKIGEAKALANDIIDKANKDSETIKIEKLLEAKEEIHKWRTDAEKEQRERRNEVQKYERRVLQKEEAIERKIPVMVVTSSGGARMQESALSLMQMAKTSCAVARLDEEGILYLCLLTEPTFGGVTASFGTLGDIIIAEKNARIGFAGRRVIEQTIRQKLPSDFQTAEYLLKNGQVDVISARKDLRKNIANILSLHKL